MPYETVRHQIRVAARLHQQLQHRYTTLAALEEGRTQRMLQVLADQEGSLADGLLTFAKRTDVPALDTWVQFPVRPDPLPPYEAESAQDLPAVAAEWDAAVAEVYRPLRSVGAEAVQELCESLDNILATRARARANLVAQDNQA